MITGDTAVSILEFGEEPPNIRSDSGTSSISPDMQWTGADLESLVERVEQRVGGCDGAVRSVVQAVCWSLLCAPAFASYGLSPPAGVLLYGPPGTGKTLLAG